MEVLADRPALGHGGDGLRAEILRVRRGEPDTLDPLYRVQGTEEVREARPVLTGPEISAVRIDVLAEQGDLPYAIDHQRFDFPDDVAQAPAHLGSPHRRDYAERARVVTSHLDRDPRRVEGIASDGERRRIGLVLLHDLDDCALSPRALEQVRRVGQVVRTEDHVDVGGSLEDALAVLLRETTTHCYLNVGPRGLERLEAPELPVQLVVGVLANATRVEHDHVGGLDVVDRGHALCLQQARDAFRVVLVHLAAKRAHVEAASPGHSGRV